MTEDIRPRCRSLPVEVLLDILQLLTKSDLCECALVCRAWYNPVQTILYSNVKIENPHQLENFYRSVVHNSRLGEKAKVLTLNQFMRITDMEVKEVFFQLLSNLLCNELPDIQELFTVIHAPVLRALQNSGLKKLKVLQPPYNCVNQDEISTYLSCVSLMYDRIENISISYKELIAQDPASSLLYNNLNQFIMLKEVNIRSGVSCIPVTEHVTANCKALKKLTYYYSGEKSNADDVDVDINTIVPSTNVELLNIRSNNDKMFLYILLKFPQLRRLMHYNLSTLIRQNLSHGQAPEGYTRFLNYLSKMTDFHVDNFLVDHHVSKSTANYWDSVSAKAGSKIVKVGIDRSLDSEQDYEVAINKSKYETNPTISFSYPVLHFDMQLFELIDNLCKYIGEFYLINARFGPSLQHKLPQNFMKHLLNRCSHLHTLYFESWVIQGSDFSVEKFSIDKLYFEHFVIVGNCLNSLSSVLSKLGCLFLSGVVHYIRNAIPSEGHEVEDDDISYLLNIDMPYTEIGEIYLDGYELPPYIKVFVTSENTYHYYRCKNDSIIHTNAEVFKKEESNEGENFHFSICCLNKPAFLILP